MGGQDFTDEQKRYLEGFVSGVQASRAAAGLRPLGGVGATEPVGPDAAHLEAMARFEAQGKKLVAEEKAKRDEHPFDAYAQAQGGSLSRPVPERRRQLPLAIPWALLRGADAECLHVPAAHPQRHSHPLAARAGLPRPPSATAAAMRM